MQSKRSSTSIEQLSVIDYEIIDWEPQNMFDSNCNNIKSQIAEKYWSSDHYND